VGGARGRSAALPLHRPLANDRDRSPGTVAASPSGSAVVLTGPVRGETHHQVVGTVTGIDRNDGQLKFKTADGSDIEVKLPPFALATVREGDRRR
jgi:hypothetical protein